MKRFLGPLAAGAVLAALLIWLGGCRDNEVSVVQPAPAEKFAPPRIKTNTFNVSSGAKNTVRDKCLACHDTQHGTEGYAADVHIIPGSPWTVVTTKTAQQIHDATCDGRAPANSALTGAQRVAMDDWTVTDLGAEPTTCTVPSEFHWTMADQIEGMSDGDDADAPGRFFARTVEYAHRPQIKVEHHTDSQSHTVDCVALIEHTAVPYPDSFAHSDDPVDYINVRAIPWNGNLKETYMSGYVAGFHHQFVTMHVIDMREGPDVNTRRAKRTYVRLQWDYVGKFMLRLKRSTDLSGGVNDEYETIGAWQGFSGASGLAHDSGAGGINTFAKMHDPADSDSTHVISPGANTWFFVKYWCFFDGNGCHYRGEIYNYAQTKLYAQVAAVRADTTLAFGGFAWGAYERSGTNEEERWGDWQVDATSMQGAGEGHGAECRDCELSGRGNPVRTSSIR